MSLAIAPPTVTLRVPGSTGGHNPNGSVTRSSVSRLTPASTSTSAASASTEWIRFSAVVSSTRPPAFCAGSPYERPRPRAITPRCPAVTTARAIRSGSGVVSTSATVGALRPQPVKDRRVVFGAGFTGPRVVIPLSDAETFGQLRGDLLERVLALVGGEHVTYRAVQPHVSLVEPHCRGAQFHQQV